jgi:hypothetical protein
MQGARPNGAASLGHFDGLVREWRQLPPLLMLRRSRLRSHRSGRHLRAGMSADRGEADLRIIQLLNKIGRTHAIAR